MNTMGLRQKALVAVLAVVLVYGLTGLLGFTFFAKQWKMARTGYERSKATYERECVKIAEKAQWIDAFETEKRAMPLFESGQDTDTIWLSAVDELARTNNVWISQRDPGSEVQFGEVYQQEVIVNGHGWEGALESLVHFLYDLETSEKGMFDVKAITIKPNASKKGYLRGSFTISCAYMRKD